MATTRQVSLHGRKAFLTRKDKLVVKSGYVSGTEDGPNIFAPAPDTVAMYDDFLADFSGTGNTVDTGRAGLNFLAKATDTGLTSAIASGVAGGVYRITSSQTITTATPASSSRSIVGQHLAWKGDSASGEIALRMAARVRASGFPSKTSGDWTGLFVGFTDTVAHEVPLYDTGRGGDSGASAVSPASNAVGFMWGTGGDTGFRGVSANSGRAGGANDSGDQQVTLTTVAPTANKWYDFELQLRQTAGDTGAFVAEFYIDGKYQGKIDQPINPTVALTPVVSFYDTGGAFNCDIDYINVSAPRDTGS